MVSNYILLTWTLLPFVSSLHFLGLNFGSPSLILASTLGALSFFLPWKGKTIDGSSKSSILLLILIIALSALPILMDTVSNIDSYNKGLMTSVFGMLAFIGYLHSYKNYPNASIAGLKYGFYLFILVGVFESLSMLNILPGNVKDFINTFFSGKTGERLRITSFEPSAAGRLCAFYFVLFFFIRNRIASTLFVINVAMLLLTYSVFGWIVLLIGFFFTYHRRLVFLVKRSARLKSLCLFLAIFLIGGSVLGNTVSDSHAIKRFTKFADVTELSELAILDGSIALRVYSQAVAIDISIDSPTGVGAGQFSEYFEEYGYRYFGSLLRFPEVRNTLFGDNANAQSLFARTLAEGGIISLLLFIFFIVRCYPRSIEGGRYYPAMFSFGIAIGCIANTSSFGFPVIWVCLAMASSGLTSTRRRGDRINEYKIN